MRHVKQVGTFLGLGTLILSLAACGSGEKRREACLSPALEKNIYGFNPCNTPSPPNGAVGEATKK